MLEVRRHNGIMAFKSPDGFKAAFHTQNLETAEITEELWQAMAPPSASIDLSNNTLFLETELALQYWERDSREPSQGINAPHFHIQNITINVTQICNLHCTYCAAGGDGSYGDPIKKISLEKTIPQLKFFMEKLKDQEEFRINFVGGEPLLYPEGIEILAEVAQEISAKKNLRLNFKIVTNGTQFNEKTILVLEKIKPQIILSLDGPPTINDQRRPSKGGKGVTATILEGLQLFKKIRHHIPYFEISGVFGPGNMDLQNAFSFYQSLSPDMIDFTYDHHDHNLKNSQEFISEYAQLAEKLFSEGGESALRKINGMDLYFKHLDQQIQIKNFCGAGKSFLVIDGKNNLYTCPWDSGIAKEMVGTGLQLFDEALALYQAPLVEKLDCQTCWAKNLCGGGCMYIHKNSTGFKNKVDPAFCFRIRALISIAILYYVKSRTSQELNHENHISF